MTTQGFAYFDWAAYSEAVAADIFGDCNERLSRAPEDIRFGNKGSVSINYVTGEWYDHENERGGGIKELIRVYKGIEDRDEAISYAKKCRNGGTGNVHAGNNAGNNAHKSRPNGNANKSQRRELEATYPYHDADGQLAFEVCRFVFKEDDGSYALNKDGKRSKAFLQRRPLDGRWLWGVGGGEFMRPGPGKDWVDFDANKFSRYPAASRQQKTFAPAPVLPYRLPELLQALAAGQTICVAEGEKKVDRIRELGFPATCNAGGSNNWQPEHTAFLKGADIVLLPDNDDVGREFVMSIATDLCAIAKRVRVLELPDLPPKGDVVDWQGGAEEFAKLVAAAQEYIVDENAGPQPLMRPLPPPEPFPINALGPDLAAAANAIHDIVQAPIEICAGAVLASASLAISAHIDVKLPTGETKPVSTYFWCIAVSGERKTSVDNRACAAQSQREQQLRTGLAAEQERHRVRHAMWQARSKALTKQFDKSGEAGSEAHQLELEKLGPEPEPPLETLLTSSDFTFEGLVHCLNVGQPIYGIIGSEGGQFVGGHGMTDDAKLRTISNLCAVWDGKPIKRVRAKEIIVLYNRRVGMHLMLQPEVAAIALGDSLLHAQGFLARVLTCFPESMIGTRLHKEPPPEAVQSVQDYNKRVLAILGTPYPLVEDSRNELDPREVPFSKEAEKLFWEFADEVEEAQNAGGEYETLKAFAGKLPEHAARLAAVIAGYRDLHATELGREDLLCGIRLASFYAAEAKRLIASAFADPTLLQAQKLLDWLRQDWNSDIVTAREIYTYGPNTIRDRNTALALATILVDHGWLKPIKKRRRDMSEWEIVGKE